MTTTLAHLPEAPAGSGITYRRFAGLDDVDGMGKANARLRAYAGILDPIDPEAMRHRYTHLVNSDPLVDCLVVERGGRTVGYARVEWHDLVDGDRVYDTTVVVEPDAWGLGIAEALVDWGERRCREVAAGNPTDRRTWFANFSFDGDTEVDGVLTDRGYAKVRWDAEMLRPDMDNLPEADLPDGYEIRIPTEGELPAVFEMSVLAFSEHWGQSEADEQRYEDWADDPRFRRDLQVVAWQGDEPVALVSNVIETRDDGSVMGLLNGVCTHPGHRRLGLARACIAASLPLLRDEGATAAFLGVDTDNHNRAIELYRSCGFEVVEQQHAVPQALRGRGGQPMTTGTEPMTTAIAVVDAPPIPGLTFRPGRDGDWPMVADVVNRVRLSDGIEEILTAEGMVAEYGALDGFRVDRDLLVAELDGVPIGISLGQRNLRDATLVLDLWGAVVPEYRRRGIGTSLHRTARARLIAEAAADPRPGPRRLQTFANELERGDIALLLAEGFAPDPLRLRDASPPYRRAARGGAARRRRTPSGDPRPGPGHPGGGQRGLPGPLGPSRDDGARADGQARRSGLRRRAVARGLGRRRGRRIRAERDLSPGQRAPRGQPRMARSRVRPPPVARSRRGEGAVRGLVPGAPGAWDRGGMARRGRVQPDRRAPAVRGPRVRGRPALVRLRAAAGRSGTRGLAAGGVAAAACGVRDSTAGWTIPSMRRSIPASLLALAAALALVGCSAAPGGPADSATSSGASLPAAASPATPTSPPAPASSAAATSPDASTPSAPSQSPTPEATMPDFALTSTSFDPGGAIPKRFTCDGEDVSPELSWSGAPEGTAALTLIVDDPDANGFVHWIVLDMTGSSTGALAHGVGVSPDAPAQGRNGFGKIGWGGPCPPSGTHHYAFTLYATAAPLALAGQPDGAEVRKALAKAEVLGKSALTGTYRRGG